MNGCAVIMCDPDGRVRSATPGAGGVLGVAEPAVGALLEEALGASPALQQWVTAAAEGARAGSAGDACAVVDGADAPLALWLGPVVGDGAGFVLVASPSEPPAPAADAVTQQAWHDIKNHLGGLKLYATFLRMKLTGHDEVVRETAGKIVVGVDAVVAAIAEARRTGTTAKGERA